MAAGWPGGLGETQAVRAGSPQPWWLSTGFRIPISVHSAGSSLLPVSLFLPHYTVPFPWLLYIFIPFQVMPHEYLWNYLKSSVDYHFQHLCSLFRSIWVTRPVCLPELSAASLFG